MTAETDEQLERALTELTTWRGLTRDLWRRALATTKGAQPRTPSRLVRLLHQRPSAAVAAAIIVVALGITIGVNLPHLGLKREARRWNKPAAVVTPSAQLETAGEAVTNASTLHGGLKAETLRTLGSVGYAGGEETGLARYAFREGISRGRGGAFGVPMARARHLVVWGGAPQTSESLSETLPAATSTNDVRVGPRHIVRKATIEFATDDVRAAFLKATFIISEADSEYVQDSSLTGSGKDMQANLTLRVAARRLPEVLNALRELGEVRSELVSGQDVSRQVVDLEARLRNEQRVEAELLELLEKRSDAPLTEILQLRATLSEVRSVIERLTAQRQQLGRLVSLATVLVIIRTKDAPDEPAGFSIGAYFGQGVQRAWQKGLMLLADTCGFLLSVIVGGLIWWVLLVIAFSAFWRYRRRRLAAATTKS